MIQPLAPAAVLAVLAFALAFGLTPAVRRVLLSRGIVDRPNQRSSHVEVTPRGGGVAVLAAIIAAWMAGIALGWMAAPPPGVAAGLALVAAISGIDDIRHLRASIRLGAHLAAAALAVTGFDADRAILADMLPLWIDRTIAAVLLAWWINLFNFMDGINGITAVETAVIGAGTAIILAVVALPPGPSLPLILVGSALGFLVWNARGRVFLGDVGSVPLGFLTGWLLLTLAASDLGPEALILAGYYLADSGITIARRAAKGERVWEAHRTHFYQRAVQRGLGHGAVTARIAALGLLLVGLAFWSTVDPGARVAAITVAALAVAALLTELRGRKSRG